MFNAGLFEYLDLDAEMQSVQATSNVYELEPPPVPRRNINDSGFLESNKDVSPTQTSIMNANVLL